MVKGDQVVEPIRVGFSLLSHQRRLDQRNAVSLFSLLSSFSINLLVVYRESVNLIGFITRRLSADSLRQDSCSRDCIRDPLSNLNQYTWCEWCATFEPDDTFSTRYLTIFFFYAMRLRVNLY